MSVRIATFNIQALSMGAVSKFERGRSKKDLKTIAKIIKDNNIDIIAIQET